MTRKFNDANRNISISRAALGGFGRVALNATGRPQVNWDACEPIVTPTAPQVEFGIVDEPCVWRPPNGAYAGCVCVSVDAVAVTGSEWRSLELVYSPKYLLTHGLTDESTLLAHAREQVRLRLCGCTGERARSNGERLILMRFEDSE